MANSIEDRIVAMKMENQQFEKAVNQSLQSWTKLEGALNKGIAAKGLDSVQSGVGRFNLHPIEDALSGVSKAWLAMSTIAVTALATITSQVVQTGLQTAKSLTIEPLMQGFNEYSTNLNSIQTVLANTQAQGTNLDDVNAALQQLNNYSDKTIYNFGEMAKNIGTFTAAGVSLDKSVESIKGIANLAALSGSSSEQASTAMYQLSQAIAAGRVSLQDWNSVVNAGMGGATFQRALVTTAQAMGTIKGNVEGLDDPMAKLTVNGKSFRDSISAIGGEQWLTSDVLTKTLGQFTGDMTDAQLAAEGFNAAQIKAIQATAKTAQEAATKVKTIKQVFDVAKETIGSGWALTFQRIFGDFEQARTTFTQLSNFLGGIIKSNANARNKILKQWGDMGGRTKIISAITNAWKALMSVLGPIHDAFREIFPAKTGEQLFQLSKGLNQLMRHLRLTKDAQENLKRTFAGLFAVIHIGLSILEGLAHILFTVLGLFVKGQGSTLEFTGGIGDMLVALDKFLTGGDRMKKFFDGIAKAITFVLKPLLDMRSALIGAFAGLLTGDTTRFFDNLSSAIQTLLGLVDSLSDKFASVFNKISDSMGGIGHIQGFDLAGMFGGLGAGGAGAGAASSIDKITNGVKGLQGPSIKLQGIWEGIQRVFAAIGDFISPLTGAFSDAASALGKAFSDVFNGTAKKLNFDQFLGAINTGLLFAIYLAFKRFTTGISDVTDAASGVLKQVTSNLKSMQADVRSDVILKIGIALGILAASVFLLSKTDPQSLGIALGALSAMLIGLVVAVKVLEKGVDGWKGGAKLALVSAGMIGMATALLILSGAVFIFGKMDPATLSQGLMNIAIALALLTGVAVAMSKGGAGANMIGAATGLLIMSAALVALSGALKIYSAIDTKELLKSIGKAMLVIAGLGAAMQLARGTLGGAAALLVVAFALRILAKAMQEINKIGGMDMVKVVAAIAYMLGVIAVALYAMEGALPGAGALIVAAGALAILGPALLLLGKADLTTIGKGLLAFVAVMAAFAVASFLMAPVVPIMLALGAALFLIGSAVFLAGTGIAALATGLALLAHNGEHGFQVFKNIIMEFLDTLPEIIDGFGATLEALAKLIGDHAPALAAAFYELMGKMLDAGTKLLPKIGKFISKLIETALRVLVNYYDDLARAGLELITRLLDAFGDKVPDIAHKAADLAIAFVRAMSKESVRFANAALDALVDFLNGLADAITNHQAQLNNAGGRVAVAIIAGITAPIRNAGSQILDAINAAWNWAKDAFHPHLSIGGHDIIGRTNVNMFAQMAKRLGLIGGVDSVRDAFSTMNDAIDNELQKAQDKLTKSQDKLKKLKKAGKGDSKEANAIRDDIEKEQKALKELQKEEKNWEKGQKAHRAALIGMAKTWDDNAKHIEDATQALKDAEAARDSFQAGVIQQFGAKPDIQPGMSLAAYMRQIQKKTLETQKFMETLQKLREQGLSDESYRQLLAEGTDAQRLMEQMLAGGTTAIGAFNQANSALAGAASTLASTASVSLFYDAAVAEAQGVLKGWQDSQGALEAQMTIVAQAMVKAIKKALKMKSPSRVFAEVGKFSTEGVSMGLEDGIGGVEKSSEKVGYAALDAMQAVMNKGVDTGSLDMTPVIAPVLDLTQLQKDATKIGTMLATQPLVASVSYERANSISNDQEAAAAAALAALTVQPPGDTTVEYTQILQSPKAISPIDTYRATKSAIPLMKEALNV